MQIGRFQRLLTANGLVPTCRFSTIAVVQGLRPETAALDSKSLTADVKFSQTANPKPQLGESQGKPNDSSTGTKGPQSSVPKMALPELIRALSITGVHISGRLRARTARIIMHELKRRFTEQLFEYRNITSGRYKQRSNRANSQSIQVKPGLKNTTKGESVIRRVPLKKKGDSRKEQRDTRNDKDIAKKREDSTHSRTQKKRAVSPEKKKTQAPPIRKLSINPNRTPETLNKTLRILTLEVSRLADEAGPVIAAIRSRQPHTIPQLQARSPSRPQRFLNRQRAFHIRLSAPRRPRKETSLHASPRPRRRGNLKKQQHRPTVRRVRARLRVRRVQARPPVAIKLYPSFTLGTIRFPDSSRAKLKRRPPPRHLLRSSSSQRRSVGRSSVTRRVPVDTTVSVQRKREAARLRRQREREARKLAETVESWLGGNGAGGRGEGI